MLGSTIVILYGLVSVMGSVAILFKGSAKTASGCINFFLLCHVLLIAMAIYALFTPLHFIWFMGCCVACLVSRWLNGKYIFGRNNWLHYVIVALIFTIAYFLT